MAIDTPSHARTSSSTSFLGTIFESVLLCQKTCCARASCSERRYLFHAVVNVFVDCGSTFSLFCKGVANTLSMANRLSAKSADAHYS